MLLVQQLSDVKTDVCFSWSFPHGHKMTAAVPAIMGGKEEGKEPTALSLLLGEKILS